MKRITSLLAAIMIILSCFPAFAKNPTDGWVLCTPGSSVNVRWSPTRHSEAIAEVYAGDYIELTGKKRGRWYECDVPCEAGVGWIRGDYLVFDKPTIHMPPVECTTNRKKVYSRYSIKGNRFLTMKKGTKLSVYIQSDEWCVTSKGFVMTKFIEGLPDEEEMLELPGE